MTTEEIKKITNKIGKPQKGRIKVHSRIIKDLSSGIYSSVASCIKELINNSYDADAEEVTVRIKPLEDSIVILDDGNGMNAEEFDSKFTWISKSGKRGDNGEVELSDKFDRPLIGKIGIGFIAVSEICGELEIESSKEGEPFKFKATINFEKYFNEDVEYVDPVTKEKGLLKGIYDIENFEEDESEHYTLIKIKKVKKQVIDIFNNKRELSKIAEESNKKYFKQESFASMKDLIGFQKKHQGDLKSISRNNDYIKFIYDLASYLPIEYMDEGPVKGKKDKIIEGIKKELKDYKFKVDFDGFYLKKPIFFNEKDSHLQEVLSFKDSLNVNGKEISFKGYFYMQHGLLKPVEFNGIAVRIKGIPIARRYGFENTFMGYPAYTDQLFRNWIFGEIYIEKGLEDAMNIDRHSFRETHSEYMALQDYVHKMMRNKIFHNIVLKKIYEKNKESKEKEKEKEREARINKIMKDTQFNPEVNDEKEEEIPKEDNKKKSLKKNSGNAINKKSDKDYSTEVEAIEDNVESKEEGKGEKENTLYKVPSMSRFLKRDAHLLNEVFLCFEVACFESKGDINKLKKIFCEKIDEMFGK